MNWIEIGSGKSTPLEPLSLVGLGGMETFKIDENTIGVRPKWISVEDKVPSDTNDVLIIDDNNRMAVSCYFFSHDRWIWEEREDLIDLIKVTHWMPLPPPPENSDS